MKKSTKKTLGSVGALVFFGVCAYAVVRDPELIRVVLWPFAGLIAALFGIKTFGGALIQKNQQNGGSNE